MVYKMEDDDTEYETLDKMMAAWDDLEKTRFQALPWYKKLLERFLEYVWYPIESAYLWVRRYVYKFIQYTKRGFDDEQLWSLDQTIAVYIYPRLVDFRIGVQGYPDGITFEEWQAILNKMEFSFKVLSEGIWNYTQTIEQYEATMPRVQEGLDLFAKYYTHLWW